MKHTQSKCFQYRGWWGIPKINSKIITSMEGNDNNLLFGDFLNVSVWHISWLNIFIFWEPDIFAWKAKIEVD